MRVIAGSHLATAILALTCLSTTVAAATPLIRNGSFTEGADGAPEDWHTTAWTPDTASFAWEVAPDGTGSIRIVNAEPNDSRWCQTVSVQPGATYRVSARVKTSDVGTTTVGAHIAIEPRVTDSPEVRGTRDWQSLDVVARAGEESSWEVCGRLGSYANLNTGTVWFTDFAMVLVARAAPRPSLAWRIWQQTQWSAIVLPLLGGLLLALGLGIGMGAGRAHRDEISGNLPRTDPATTDDPPSDSAADTGQESPQPASASTPAESREPGGGPDGDDTSL